MIEATPLPTRFGRYEVEQRLAHGGMAELFVARLVGGDGFTKRVVVKRALPELARERAFVDMFLHEARVAATLDHANIVAVHDLGRDDQGQFFFAMELLHGADLCSLLRAQAELPVALAVELVRGAAAGLHYAHERCGADGASLGLVHRDVSPQNLFATFDGTVKLLDFGIAKAADRIADRATRTGTLRGKVPYMSPEQCRGEALDRRSDIFSLGIVLWELLSGERLYGARDESDFEVFKQIAERDAPAVRREGCPDDLGRIVVRALARDRDRRFQTMAELHDALDALDLAMSAREIGAFVARHFPGRAEAWRRGAHVAPVTAVPRATVELAAGPSTQLTTPVAITNPPPSAPAPRRAGWRRWLVAGLIVTLAAGAAFVAGRRTSATPAAAGPSVASPVMTPMPPPPPPVEDAHWFQPDDFLVAHEPYTSGRLNGIRVAKQLAPPDHPGGVARFLDGNAEEIATASYWRSHVAQPAELAVGALAFCRVESYELSAIAPPDKAATRTQNWALARITEIGEVATGRVRVGDVACEVAGVRVPD